MSVLAKDNQDNQDNQDDRANWQARAACVGEMGVAFYPPLNSERKAIKVARENRAKAICAACSVRTACLEYAIEVDERYGIWGGLSYAERRSSSTPHSD